MDRRELLKMIAVLTGGAVIGGEVFLSGCTNNSDVATTGPFTETDIAYLDEVADTILPATKTPGAKAAKVGMFMTVMVRDCYTEDDQKVFREGMNKLNEASKKKHNETFMESTPAQRTTLLIELDKEAKAYNKEKGEKDKAAKAKDKDAKNLPNHYFTMMKQLTMTGYFTSKEGATQALEYVPVPGRYDGCVDYTKGKRAWAT